MAVSYSGQILYRNGVPEHVGRYASGTMQVTAGSTADIGGSEENRLFALGQNSGGVGTVSVEGTDSTLNFDVVGTSSTLIQVGDEGTGSLTILDGGTLNYTSDNREAFVQLVVEGDTDSSFAAIDGSILMEGFGATVFASGSETQTGVSLLEGSELSMRGAWQSRLIVDTQNGLHVGSGSSVLVESGVGETATSNPGRDASRVIIGKSFDTAEAAIENSEFTVSALVGSAAVEVGYLPGTTGTAAYGGKLSVTDNSLLDIAAAMDVMNATASLGVGGRENSIGELILTDSDLRMSGHDVDFVVGALSATGWLSADNSTMSLAATDRVSVYLGLTALSGGEGEANVLLNNGTTFDLSGEDVDLNVLANGDTAATFSIRGGSVVTLNATGSSAFDNTVDVYGYSDGEAVIEVEEAGSSLTAGFIRVGELLLGPLGGAADGNGTLAVRNGGHVEANYLLVNDGGTLKLKNATLAATGYGPSSGSDLGVKFVDAALRISGRNESVITADAVEMSNSTVEFSVINSDAATLRIETDRLDVSSASLNVIGGRTAFDQGDEFMLMEVDTGSVDGSLLQVFNLIGAVNSNGITLDGFEYAYTETIGETHTIGFIALNDGFGLGSSDLHFERTSAEGVDFLNIGANGVGIGGGYTAIRTTAIDRLFATDTDDTVDASGSIVSQAVQLFGFDGKDFLIGGRADDLLSGGRDNDKLSGMAGDDRLGGHLGRDRLDAGEGNDRLSGGAGADRLLGRAGDDRLAGGEGDDRLVGGEGNDVLLGQSGADSFVFGKTFDRDTIADLEIGIDSLLLNDNLWEGTLSVSDVLDQFGRQVNTTSVLDFGNGDVLRVANTQLSDLVDDLVLI